MSVSTAFIISLQILLLFKGTYGGECKATAENNQGLNIKIKSQRNDEGEWTSAFTAEKKTRKDLSVVDMDATFNSSECDGKKIFLIRGVLKGGTRVEEERSIIPSVKETERNETLIFHLNCGTNVAITNKGRSIVKIDNLEFGNDVAMTNRPLRDNEIFEVRLDKKLPNFWYGMGIGVTTFDPKDTVMPKHMSYLETGNWMFFHSGLWRYGRLLKTINKQDFDKVGEGVRLGVKRTESRALHLYIDGVDTGPAATDVPAGVFGVYQLHGFAAAATIVC